MDSVAGLVTILGNTHRPSADGAADMLLACSISLAVAILVITSSAKESLELSTFPTLLLFTTRFACRSTSLHDVWCFSRAMRQIIQILRQISSQAAALGSRHRNFPDTRRNPVHRNHQRRLERISEVAARFTLDAMPGKQMAIDADLNAGLITEQQANERRTKIVKESEFYGAMDGASKFIRGDAKAGIIIVINVSAESQWLLRE
jgi:flagellar biosynthesis protein FlhA